MNSKMHRQICQYGNTRVVNCEIVELLGKYSLLKHRIACKIHSYENVHKNVVRLGANLKLSNLSIRYKSKAEY